MFTYDTVTKAITMPKGDTGVISVSLTDAEGQAFSPALSGYGIFAVCQKSSGGQYTTVSSVYNQIVNNTLAFVLTNEMTAKLPLGNLFYDIRIVLGGTIDSGNVVTDESSDEVHSLFAGSAGGMPQFNVRGVSYDVEYAAPTT